MTHQKLCHAVLFPNVAEIPRDTGLKPDVLPIDRSLLKDNKTTQALKASPERLLSP